MPGRIFRSLPCERGAAAIEFAVVLPLLMLLAFGMIDLGRAIWVQSTLNYAAQATARCAALSNWTAATGPCPSSAATVTYGQSQAYALDSTKVNVDPSTAIAGCTGQPASVSMTFSYVFPFFRRFSGTFTGTACYPK